MPRNVQEVRSWVRAALAAPGNAGSVAVVCPRCDRAGIAVVEPDPTGETGGLNVTITWRDREYQWVERSVLPDELSDPDFGCGFDTADAQAPARDAGAASSPVLDRAQPRA